jgi:addiction module HigA family antidote
MDLPTMTLTVPTNRRPILPGAVLREDYLEPLGLTQGQLATALGVDRTSVSELINGRRSMSTEMALRLAHVFSNAPQYWLNLQTAVDLYDASHSDAASEIEQLQVLIPA